METRASHVRAVFASLCESSVGARDDSRGVSVSNAVFAAADALWDAAPARHAEVLGPAGDDGVADRFADAVAGVSAVVVRRFAAKLHATPPGPGAESGASLNALNSFHAAGAGACVAAATSGPRSVAASRFTAMTHVIAARHAHITAVVSSAEAVAASALAAAAYAGSARAEAAAASRARNARSTSRSTQRAAVVGARELFSPSRRGSQTESYDPRDDPPLVGAVVALTHALWERGPPRAPTETARDAAADVFFEDAFSFSETSRETDDGRGALASFVLSAVFRRALVRCVPNRVLMDDDTRDTTISNQQPAIGFAMNASSVTHGGHMYPPGATSAALGTIRVARRLLSTSELRGSLPETIAGTFPVIASALLDATHPPPPPPDPRRSAPPSGAQAAPPAVRRAAYGYFADLAARAPGACGDAASDEASLSFRAGVETREYLRAFPVAPPPRVVDAAVRAALRAAVTFAACEVAAASGFKGALEAARTVALAEARAHGFEDGALTNVSVDERARRARAEARRALRGLLGAHPSSGAHEEVLRRFKPPAVRHDSGVFGHQKPPTADRGPIADGAVARDAPAGKDFDAANAALAFLRAYASVSRDASEVVRRDAFPILSGALSEHGAGNARRYTRANVVALWDATRERLRSSGARGGDDASLPLAPLPPAPPEAASGAPRRVADSTHVVRSSRDALNHRNGRAHALSAQNFSLEKDPRVEEKKSPWPSSASAPATFANVSVLCDAARRGDADARRTKVSVIGAVVSKDPAVGVKSLKNPKTGKAYDMAFLTLADHTGARCAAQLLGAKARAAAAILDAILEKKSGARVVVGLCDVSPRAGGAKCAVWDPKETSAFVLRPEHPAASRL